MWIDPIVEEIRTFREKRAEAFAYDLRKLYEDLKRQEGKAGRTFVQLPIRRKASETRDAKEAKRTHSA